MSLNVSPLKQLRYVFVRVLSGEKNMKKPDQFCSFLNSSPCNIDLFFGKRHKMNDEKNVFYDE